MADKRIPAPAMGTQGTTPTTSPSIKATACTDHLMRAFTTESALALLWKKASRELHLHELEWFADGAAEQVGRDAGNLADVLESVGCLVAGDEHSGSFQDQHSTSRLLFNLKTQIEALAGLADIASDAGSMVRSALKDGAA